MVRRRRAVERAAFRQVVTDRIIVGMLAVVAASGLMSVLPAYSQVAVSRLACRAASLGLGACGVVGIDLENTRLTPARCKTLSALDEFLPEVRVEQVTTERGLAVTISQTRSGDVFVQLGGPDQSVAPNLLAGERRQQRQLLPGVEVASHAEWLLPRGQGLDDLVIAAHDGQQQWVERRSALALVASPLFNAPQTIPEPALLQSEVRLDSPQLPRFRDTPEVPRIATPKPDTRPGIVAVDELTIDSSQPASFVLNRNTGESSTVTALRGTVAGHGVTGTVRLTRNSAGTVTAVLATVVSENSLVPGEQLGSLPGPAVAYISIPVRTGPERRLVQQWVSEPNGFTLGVRELLRLRPPRSDDQLGSFLTRAATVTVLRYAFVSPAQLQSRVSEELRTLRRQNWDGVEVVAVNSIAPQPSGGRRIVVNEPACRT